MVYKSDYKSLLDSDIYVIVPGLMIAAGVVVIIVAIVGCLGAIKENRFFLISVSTCISVVKNIDLIHNTHHLCPCFRIKVPVSKINVFNRKCRNNSRFVDCALVSI